MGVDADALEFTCDQVKFVDVEKDPTLKPLRELADKVE